MSDLATVAATSVTELCPVCERTSSTRPFRQRLYGVPVCKRCRNAFANRRQTAYLIDWIAWIAATAFPLAYLEERFYGSGMTRHSFAGFWGFDSAFGFIVTWILPFVFFCKDGFQGMSLGKWMTGVQVVDVHTREPIGFARSLKRNFVLLVPFGVLIVAGTMMKGQRWGDKGARTAVIWRKKAHKLPFDPRGVLCTGCGYDLTGNVSGRCPECFTPIGRPPPPPASPSFPG